MITRRDHLKLSLAQERGIAVMVYVPFGRTRLWERVRGQQVPAWAAEFDAHSWAQYFLKFVLAHPAVTVITPATSRAQHMLDNLGAALGRLPDAAMQRRMIEHLAALPAWCPAPFRDKKSGPESSGPPQKAPAAITLRGKQRSYGKWSWRSRRP